MGRFAENVQTPTSESLLFILLEEEEPFLLRGCLSLSFIMFMIIA